MWGEECVLDWSLVTLVQQLLPSPEHLSLPVSALPAHHRQAPLGLGLLDPAVGVGPLHRWTGLEELFKVPSWLDWLQLLFFVAKWP